MRFSGRAMSVVTRTGSSWWQVAAALLVLPAVLVPFLPFVEGVVPWEQIADGLADCDDAGGTLWFALPTLLGVWLAAVFVRALVRQQPLRFERSFTWVASAVSAACVVMWYGQFWTEVAADDSFFDRPWSWHIAAFALFAIPLLCLAAGVLLFPRAGRWAWLMPQRAVVVAALVYLADVASCVFGYGMFSKDAGWPCALVACAGVVGTLVGWFRSAPPRVTVSP